MDSIWKWVIGTSVGMMLALGALAYGGASGATQTAPAILAPETPAAQPEEPRIDFRPAIAANVEGEAETEDDGLSIKSILPVEGVMKYGEWHWNTDAAPDKGKLIVTVDLQARVVSVFKGGHEIGTAVAMLGTDSHPTPTGQFKILWKQRHNVSEKYNNAPMPWSMFLTRDGIAIHGGSEVENGYASHGCIAVPDPFADRLFAIAKEGDVVVITDGKMIGQGDSLI